MNKTILAKFLECMHKICLIMWWRNNMKCNMKSNLRCLNHLRDGQRHQWMCLELDSNSPAVVETWNHKVYLASCQLCCDISNCNGIGNYQTCSEWCADVHDSRSLRRSECSIFTPKTSVSDHRIPSFVVLDKCCFVVLETQVGNLNSTVTWHHYIWWSC